MYCKGTSSILQIVEYQRHWMRCCECCREPQYSGFPKSTASQAWYGIGFEGSAGEAYGYRKGRGSVVRLPALNFVYASCSVCSIFTSSRGSPTHSAILSRVRVPSSSSLLATAIQLSNQAPFRQYQKGLWSFLEKFLLLIKKMQSRKR